MEFHKILTNSSVKSQVTASNNTKQCDSQVIINGRIAIPVRDSSRTDDNNATSEVKH